MIFLISPPAPSIILLMLFPTKQMFGIVLCFSLPGSLLTTFLFASAFLSSRRDQESGRLWTLRC